MIKKMTHSNIGDINTSNEGFIVTGRIIPKYENDNWTYTEEEFIEPYLKQYEHDHIDSTYIDDTEKAVFLYYDDHSCIGQIRLCSHWNGYALVEDIGVSKDWRHKGIGRKLLEQAVQWTKHKQHIGLMLETQDVNVSACRFYAKNGFVIEGVDCMLYSNLPTANEKAIFWYYRF